MSTSSINNTPDSQTGASGAPTLIVSGTPLLHLPTPAELERMTRHHRQVVEREAQRPKRPELHDPVWREAYLQHAERVRSRIPHPTTHESLWPGAVGNMAKKEDGKFGQDWGSIKPMWFAGLKGRHEFIKSNLCIGEKHSGPMDYDALLLERKYARKWNAIAVYGLTVDADSYTDEDTGEMICAIRNDKDLKRFLGLAMRLGCHLAYTTSSHFPVIGKQNWKLRFPTKGHSYLDHKHHGLWIRRKFAEVLEIEENGPRWRCLDPISERGIQLEYSVRVLDAERLAHARIAQHTGRVIDLSESEDGIFRMEAEKEALKAKADEVAAEVRRRQQHLGEINTKSHPELVASSSSAKRITEAKRRAASMGGAVEGRLGGTKTFRVIVLCKGLGLTLEETWEVLVAWNPTCTPMWELWDLREKLERGYDGAEVGFGSFLRHGWMGVTNLINDISGLDLSLDTPETNKDEASKPINQIDSCSLVNREIDKYTKENLDFTSPSPSLARKGQEFNCCLTVKYLGLFDDNLSPLAEVLGGPEVAATKPPGKAWRLLEIHTRDLPEVQYSELLARVLYRRSSYGTAKNKSLRRLVRELVDASSQGRRVLVIVHRRTLARRIAAAWGMPVYLEEEGSEIKGSCVVCIDSIARIALGPIDLMVMDESEQVINHMWNGPIRFTRKTAGVWSALKVLASKTKRLIFQDANLANITAMFARKLMGWHQPHQRDEQFCLNTWAPKRPKHHRYGDETAWLDELYRSLQAAHDNNVDRFDWVGFLNAEKCKAVAEVIREKFPWLKDQMIEIHRDTTKLAHVKHAIEYPETISSKYKLVLASPSAGTGISVEDENLWHVWLDAQSGVGPNAFDAVQALCRVRDPIGAWKICIWGYEAPKVVDPQVILEGRLATSMESRARMSELCGYSMSYPKGDEGDALLIPDNWDLIEIDAHLEAHNNFHGGCLGDYHVLDKQKNPTGAIIEGSLDRALREIGSEAVHVAAVHPDPKACKEELKKAKKGLKQIKVLSIQAAEDKDLDEAEKEASKEDAPPEAEFIRIKAKLRHFFDIPKDEEVPLRIIESDLEGAYSAKCRDFVRYGWVENGETWRVIEQDRKDLDLGTGKGTEIDLKNKASSQITAREVILLWGIDYLEHHAVQGTVLVDPAPSAITPALAEKLDRNMGLKWDPATMTPRRLLSTILSRMGVKLAEVSRVRDPQTGKVKVEQKICLDIYRQLEGDTAAYKRRNTTKSAKDEAWPDGIREFDLGDPCFGGRRAA
jgi:hypothetical protein